MTDRHSCFKLMQFWEGHEDTRLLFADLVDASTETTLIPTRRVVPDPWPADVSLNFEGDGVEDIPFQVFGWFIVSDRMKNIIEERQLTGIQFYPIQVVSKVSFPLPRYWYGHVAHLDGAIDFERSVYRRGKPKGSDGEILLVFRFVLKETAVQGWDFFRPSDSTESLFCSSRFYDLALQHRFTGIGFSPVPVM